MLIPPCPPTLSQCALYKRLVEVSTPVDGLAERVDALVLAAELLLSLVATGPFREYTLHDAGHARKLVHLAGYAIEAGTIEHLSALELATIIMASYVHDLGMCVTATERAEIVATAEFEESMRQWPQLWDDLVTTRGRHAEAADEHKPALEARLFQLQEAGLASFLRPRHADRSRYLALFAQLRAAAGREDLFSLRDVSFQNELVAICESHNLDVGALLETSDAYTDRFPRDLPIGGHTLNVQFCAAVLRVVDILDFDRERTPRVLFESLGLRTRDIPGAAVTLKEWNKHMAVRSLQFDATEVVVHADSTHPAIERAIRDFCAIIEREVRDTTAVLRRNPEAICSRYRLVVPATVRAQVRSIGYAYKDLAFRLDESAISSLLMGEELYPNRAVALRELVQNAIDACRVRAIYHPAKDYVPRVAVSCEEDGDGKTWIVVTDNGIGMDEAVLFDYFFCVGRSYYRSAEFDRLRRRSVFSPISRFGIGVLSVFMIADRLEVRTANAVSPRGDTTTRVVHVESRFGLAFVRESEDGLHGTEVRIRLAMTPDAVERFLRRTAFYLRETVRRPAVPVEVALGATRFTASPGQCVALRPGAREYLVEHGVEPIELEVARWNSRFAGRVILFLHRLDDGSLSPYADAPFHYSNVYGAEYFRGYLSDFQGNRLTVNGIRMSVKQLARALDWDGWHRLSGVIDVDVVAGDDVHYDVARQRVTGATAPLLRTQLAEAIRAGMRELGLVERLNFERRGRLSVSGHPYRRFPKYFNRVGNEDVSTAALREIPDRVWTPGLHRELGEKLGLSGNDAFALLSLLRAEGKVVDPPAGWDAGDQPSQ